YPNKFNSSAAVKPAGPLPIIATFSSKRVFGTFGLTIPISYASSIIVRSIPLIATESLFIANTQDDSQGAGQTRPVNSGKLLVSDNLSKASSKSFLYTKSFHSGI